MRPLYIDGTPGCRVVLDEPALRIVMPDRADLLFPLSRISNVICSGVVDWSMSALLACADAGIHLLFLHNNGELRARWMGQGRVRQDLTQRLADLLARPDGMERYENWFRAMEKLAVRSAARRMGMADWREVPVRDMHERILQLTVDAYSWRNLEKNLCAVLLGEIMCWLNDCDFDCNDEVIANSTLDLAMDFSKLLRWDCFPIMLSESVPTLKPILASMAALINEREDRLYLLFRSCINKLLQFLYSVH